MTDGATGQLGRSMNGQTIWDIRDARGLSSNEKVFLMVIESRGDMWASVAQASADMGMSRSTFYKTRTSLIDRGLIKVLRRGPNQTTVYRVRRPAVRGLVPDKPDQVTYEWREENEIIGQPVSVSGTRVSDTKTEAFAVETPDSRRGMELSDSDAEAYVPARGGGRQANVDVRGASPEEDLKGTGKTTGEVDLKETSSEPFSEPEGQAGSVQSRIGGEELDDADIFERMLGHSDEAFRAAVISAHEALLEAENEVQQADLKWRLHGLLDRCFRSDEWRGLDESSAEQQARTAWERLDIASQNQVIGIFDEDEDEYMVLLGHLLRCAGFELANTPGSSPQI
ncbi:hypothetical protein GEV29_02850 [Aeromicrobium sp. SMF47]|uniref:hypothetical protein n=1 Tax=Aeromicrobium yanjiei TaxID=2662028 RepID=UPI00129D8F3F|nr:hypothetical protein [Aeromicrobium yanjiei]MRJ75464.1 hypothetical protein [Aeromicrobium yanjiei]